MENTKIKSLEFPELCVSLTLLFVTCTKNQKNVQSHEQVGITSVLFLLNHKHDTLVLGKHN